MKKLAVLFAVLAILLSDVMCAATAYAWCDMVWSIRYLGASAPAEVSLITAIPYLFGIIFCVILAVLFARKARKKT